MSGGWTRASRRFKEDETLAYPVLIIAQQEIAARIDVEAAIEVVEAAFRDHERGEDILPVSQPLEKGLIQRSQIRGRIGQVIAGTIPGRTSAGEITLFDGTGMAIQDAAVARRVYDRALAEGFGTRAEL